MREYITSGLNEKPDTNNFAEFQEETRTNPDLDAATPLQIKIQPTKSKMKKNS